MTLTLPDPVFLGSDGLPLLLAVAAALVVWVLRPVPQELEKTPE